MSTTDKNSDEDRPGFKSPGAVIGLGVLALCALIALVYLIIPDPAGPDLETAACERPASEDTRVTGAISVTGWNLTSNSAYIPETVYGPARMDGDVPTCFEHSPAGAIVAAATMATLGDNGHPVEVLEHLSLDTDARDDMLEETPTNPHDSTRSVAVAGRITDYTGDAASVEVVAEDLNRGGYRTVNFDLLWEDGDWKWDVPTGRLVTGTTTSITGYNELKDVN